MVVTASSKPATVVAVMSKGGRSAYLLASDRFVLATKITKWHHLGHRVQFGAVPIVPGSHRLSEFGEEGTGMGIAEVYGPF